MDTSDEKKQNAMHELKMATDFEYAVNHTMDSIYSDIHNFKEFIEYHDLIPLIAFQLNRALCNINHRDKSAVIDAVSEIREEFDAKIIQSVKMGVR